MAAEDISDVLQASRESIAYKTFTFSSSPDGDEGPDVLMGPDGRPVFVRTTGRSIAPRWPIPPRREPRLDVVTVINYTRHAPQHCDGTPAPGELVVEYDEDPGDRWTVTARQANPASEPFAPIFAALAGEVSLADAGRAIVARRQARGLRATASPPERADRETRVETPGAVQTLWIDERSFLPLRWSVSTPPAGQAASRATATPVDEDVFFVYDSSLEVHAPAGVAPPTCLDPRETTAPK